MRSMPDLRCVALLSSLMLVGCLDDPKQASSGAIDLGGVPDLVDTAGSTDTVEASIADEAAADAADVPADTGAVSVPDAKAETTIEDLAQGEDVASDTSATPDSAAAADATAAEITQDTEGPADTVSLEDAADTIDGSVDSASDVAADTVEDTADVPADTVEALPPADLSNLGAPPYLMWVTQTEVSVRWETKTPTVGRVDFGASDALDRTLSEPSARTTHELRLTDLAPDRLHSYRVVFGGGAMPIHHFYTAPPDDSDAPFSFVVWGDNQNGPDVFEELVPLMADAAPRFAISVGDCVQDGTRDEYRSQLFGPMSGFADEVPYLVAAGNHERYGDPDALLFGEYFSQPGDEHCFGWRYGGLFVLFLDTDLGLDGATGQRACIEEALSSEAATTAKIRAAAFHKPPRIEWWFGGLLAFPESMSAPWVREDLEPLLESYDVDIVFNGHNHLYAYTPETPGGITWVTTGGGGGQIDTRGLFDVWRVGNWPQIETTLHEHHFLVATLEGGMLHVQALDRDGIVMHEFWVTGD